MQSGGDPVGKTVKIILVCLTAAVMALGFEMARMKRAMDPPAFTTTYQAALLDNGQVYYGRISGLGTRFPVMTDVYYIVRTEDANTKQVKNVLVKRGKELHAPTETVFNARHIVMVEPVGTNSEVARLIAQSETPR
jgi:hypothetical protein